MNGQRKRGRRQRHTSSMRGVLDMVKLVVVGAVIIAAVVLVTRAFVNRGVADDKFCEGVYVNGISLGGMTLEEGVTLVQTRISQRLNENSFTLSFGEQQWTFTPSDFTARLDVTEQLQKAWNFGHTGSTSERRTQAEYVRNNPVHYDSEIEFDEVRLDDFLTMISNAIYIAPVSAEVLIGADETLTVTQSVNGRKLSTSALRETITQAILSGETLDIELKAVEAEPEYTTEELKANTQLIVSYRTDTSRSSSTRNKNIARALRSFNGFCIMPEVVYSFNDVVGKRTLENGFYVYDEYDGTTVVTGIGGGTCQASTTLYGALLLADATISVRYPHSMTVAYVKPSLDAAVSAKKDLVFSNHHEYPMYVYTSVDAKRAEVKIYGPPPEHAIQLEYETLTIIEPSGFRTRKDTTGEHVYYVDDPPVVVEGKEGKNGLKSRGYRVYYDTQTGEEVERELLSNDTYYASRPTCWVGIHPREE